MSRTKSPSVNATLQNKDVLQMFNSVIGTSGGGVKIEIAHPKYEKMRTHAERFVKLIEVLCGSSALAKFPGDQQTLAPYAASLRANFTGSFSAPDLSAYLWAAGATPAGSVEQKMMEGSMQYDKIPEETLTAFSEVFEAVKKCSLVTTIIVTCKNLIVHKKYIGAADKLRDKFLLKTAGMRFAPLQGLPEFNLKQLYVSSDAKDKEFLLLVMHKMYSIAHDLYESSSSPDVDVNSFSEVIIDSIKEVRGQIPRCDDAFDKISESVNLLKGNFGGYYKDYVASNNPTIIMENFVMDVAKDSNATPKVTMQFKKIIQHYRKIASNKTANSKMQALFSAVDQNFTELEKRGRQADEKDDSSSSDDEAAAPASSKPSASENVAPGAAGSPKSRKKNAKRRAAKKHPPVAAARSSSDAAASAEKSAESSSDAAV